MSSYYLNVHCAMLIFEKILKDGILLLSYCGPWFFGNMYSLGDSQLK